LVSRDIVSCELTVVVASLERNEKNLTKLRIAAQVYVKLLLDHQLHEFLTLDAYPYNIEPVQSRL
jgi:hypothetical protein